MLCRVYTCWMPARRSSHIWSRPICLSPWGFCALFDDMVGGPSCPFLPSPLPSINAHPFPIRRASDPRLLSSVDRCPGWLCSQSVWSIWRQRRCFLEAGCQLWDKDAVPLCTPGWRCLPHLHLKALALLTRWPMWETAEQYTVKLSNKLHDSIQTWRDGCQFSWKKKKSSRKVLVWQLALIAAHTDQTLTSQELMTD